MATTYLTLVNELLREMNEVPLTSSNFSSAIGLQAHAKDAVNRAYWDVVTEDPKWPFLRVADSGATDPFMGNVTVATVAGQRFYELKAASSDHTTDYGAIDWDSFYVTTIGVGGESSPYTSKTLKFVSSDQWIKFRRDSENIDDADSQNWGEPDSVIMSPDGRQFGLSPIPKKVYNVHFFAWEQPTALSAHDDAVVFPDMYTPVIIARARYFVWQFKDNPQAASFAMEDYRKGLNAMRENLLHPSPISMSDDRIYYV